MNAAWRKQLGWRHARNRHGRGNELAGSRSALSSVAVVEIARAGHILHSSHIATDGIAKYGVFCV